MANTDPMWVFENYGEAAEYIDELEADAERLTAELAESEKRNRMMADANNELTDELAEIRSSMAYRTSLIGRLEAENTALKAQSEPVYCVVTDDGTYEHHKEWVPLADCFVLYTIPQPASAHGQTLDEAIAEFEQTPEGAAAMAEGRKWVKETFYQQPAQDQDAPTDAELHLPRLSMLDIAQAAAQRADLVTAMEKIAATPHMGQDIYTLGVLDIANATLASVKEK